MQVSDNAWNSRARLREMAGVLGWACALFVSWDLEKVTWW